MTHDDFKPKAYFLALLYEYLILVRNDLEGSNLPMSADIAYALHNVPSMLQTENWTPDISRAAWKEVWSAAGFRKCRPWFEATDASIRNSVAKGHPILFKHSFDLPKDHP